MDVAAYRRQYEAELEQATSVNRSSEADGPDQLAAAMAVVRDGHADPELRSAALELISVAVDENPDLVEPLLQILLDRTVPAEARIAVLNLLQQISFRTVLFPAIRPNYLATLRSIIDDPDIKLRRRVVGILAREKDEYVQRRLIDGLEGRSAPLVPTAKAIQFLGYDVHAEHFPLLRRMVEHPPSQTARKEAIRLLAADPDAADLLQSILGNRAESTEVRQLSAVALQAAAPDRFAALARRIVLDNTEDEQLRAQAISALSLQQASANYLSRLGG
ncbi:MAG: hypothetical protein ACRDSN_18645 [Pseudonocardiaceae bacterium]